MSMLIGISGVIPNVVFPTIFTQEYIPLRPAAVRISEVVVTSVSGAPIFGLDIENDFISGLDVGAWAVSP